ncbi:MAG: hypothetical protein EAZ95_08850 [Bacteroidetes bacterium]|nr:MAG: hypothetical protein EAZ95_08850 [Bacteroidota bacterium]
MINPFLYAIIVVLGTLYRIYSFFVPQKKGVEAGIIHLDKPNEKERLTYQDLPKEVYDAFLKLGTRSLEKSTSTSGWYINLDASHIKLLEVPKKEIGWGEMKTLSFQKISIKAYYPD